MSIIYFLIFTGSAIFILLPIRHYKSSKYFYFFLLLGLTSISGLISIFIFKISANHISLLFTIFLPISLFYNFFRKHIISLLLLLLLFAYPIFQIESKLCLVFQYPFDIAVLIILFWQNSKMYLQQDVLNLFSFGVLLFGLSEVLGMIGYVKNVNAETSVILNYIAVFSQILIGIFLLIFNENNPKIIFSKSDPQIS